MEINSSVITEYLHASAPNATKNFMTLDQIDAKALTLHLKNYPDRPTGTNLMALNRRRYFGYSPFTGFLLTDDNLAFKTVKDKWLSSITLARGVIKTMPLAAVRSFQIGRHDHCLGTAYIGHQFIVNGENMGLIRMGAGITYDSKAIQAVNGFAKFLFERGIADVAPTDFAFQ